MQTQMIPLSDRHERFGVRAGVEVPRRCPTPIDRGPSAPHFYRYDLDSAYQHQPCILIWILGLYIFPDMPVCVERADELSGGHARVHVIAR